VTATPNRSTQFQPGNPGKPKGARHKMSALFVEAMCNDFEKHGEKTIERVRKDDPSTYLKVIASLLPKEITGEDGAPLITGIQVTLVRPGDVRDNNA